MGFLTKTDIVRIHVVVQHTFCVANEIVDEKRAFAPLAPRVTVAYEETVSQVSVVVNAFLGRIEECPPDLRDGNDGEPGALAAAFANGAPFTVIKPPASKASFRWDDRSTFVAQS